VFVSALGEEAVGTGTVGYRVVESLMAEFPARRAGIGFGWRRNCDDGAWEIHCEISYVRVRQQIFWLCTLVRYLRIAMPGDLVFHHTQLQSIELYRA
jgi:hypothetical protein